MIALLTYLHKIKTMKIKVTDFAARHFDRKFGGTKILDMTIENFEKWINIPNNLIAKQEMPGYADFCKLISFRNFTDARVGSMPITLENYQYLRSGYSARRESELPVFSRWLELPIGKPKAEFLVLVLYSKEQIIAEGIVDKERKVKSLYDEYLYECNTHDEIPFSYEDWKSVNGWSLEEMNTFEFDADWGIVAILGQSHPNEEPMKPETMIRNSLGKKEGGSGVPLDRDAYLKSVEFWEKNATVK